MTGALALALFSVVPCDAVPFTHTVDLFGDYTQYLWQVQNAEVDTEHWPEGPMTYWHPTQSGTWGEITYRYDLSFAITSAKWHGFSKPWLEYDSMAQAIVEASPDATHWTTIATSFTGHDYSDIDLTPILSGSTTAYIRSRLYAPGGTACAQFMRTGNHDRLLAPDVYSFQAVPEPASVLLLALGLLWCARQARRDVRQTP